MNLMNHPDWKQPHSNDWYNQLAQEAPAYSYNWSSTYSDRTGEEVFDEEALLLVKDKDVLDIGCADGQFTEKWSKTARETVGIDASGLFITKAKQKENANLSFVNGNSKGNLPFSKNVFQVGLIRKGPTSGYTMLKQLLSRGGKFLGLHPGDQSGEELIKLFPNLFNKKKQNEVKEKLQVVQKELGFNSFHIEEIRCTEWIHTPADVVKLACFGQKQIVLSDALERDLKKVTEIFNKQSTSDGLAITYSRYLIRGAV
ncbi:hypothetical protein JCM19046_1765 [Bacillus sp. JCM 19046]|nr:hypothetical protein JCM19045_2722 [Bacillus sp. JCM 19045]GAF17261.1 hypothetical protein JCM19046_1765 [Bacillus sp. JCM 19046]